MKKESLYLSIIVLLILVNALQLSSFFFHSNPPRLPEHNHSQEFRERAVEILNLTKVQKEQFFILAEKHNAQMQKLIENENELTIAYFNKPTEKGLDALLSIQSKKIKLTDNHFADIKSILSKKQLSNYEKFKKEAIKTIIH